MLARAGGVFALALLLVACGGGQRADEDATPPATPTSGLSLDGCLERGGYCGRLEPGGQLSAAAWLGDDRLYLADLEGRIRLLDVETGETRTVVTGLSNPQGLTILNDRLYVTDMGDVCERMREEEERLNAEGLRVFHSDCTIHVPGYEGVYLLEFLGRTGSRVLSYRIGEDGGLDDRQVILDRIITVKRAHSPHGLTNDGESVYVSIGHPSIYSGDNFFTRHADRLQAMGLRADLMGTIVRIEPSGRARVHASGLRNTYGISISPDGTIYGVDNDENIARNRHREEMNAIVEGGFYGYPLHPSVGSPADANVIEPVAIVDGVGSAGIHANEDGVYVGYLSRGESIVGEKPRIVVDRFDYPNFAATRIYDGETNYITQILEKDSLLWIVAIDGRIHVIDPAVAPVAEPKLSDAGMAAILETSPVIRSRFDVWLVDSALIYVAEDCTPDDMDAPFSLHLYPADVDDLPEDRREHGFANLDFVFGPRGWRRDGMCIALRNLPSWEIASLTTGQFTVREMDGEDVFETLWEGTFEP